jgi:hypothetical protein
MKRTFTFLVLLLVLARPSRTQGVPPAADPALATVRIKSHGASATIIATTEGRSWILGCAHMLTDGNGNPSDKARKKKFVIDGPVQTYAPKQPAEVKLVAWDYDMDLSLLEIANGPFHHIPVAQAGFKPSSKLWSCGYDNMSWPVTKKPATILLSQGNTTYTKEKPWHGRSGGGLADGDARVLIGVVQGYEVWPNSRGLYVSHAAILRFLRSQWKNAPPQPLDEVLPVQRQRLQLPTPLCPK